MALASLPSQGPFCRAESLRAVPGCGLPAMTAVRVHDRCLAWARQLNLWGFLLLSSYLTEALGSIACGCSESSTFITSFPNLKTTRWVGVCLYEKNFYFPLLLVPFAIPHCGEGRTGPYAAHPYILSLHLTYGLVCQAPISCWHPHFCKCSS